MNRIEKSSFYQPDVVSLDLCGDQSDAGTLAELIKTNRVFLSNGQPVRLKDVAGFSSVKLVPFGFKLDHTGGPCKYTLDVSKSIKG